MNSKYNTCLIKVIWSIQGGILQTNKDRNTSSSQEEQGRGKEEEMDEHEERQISVLPRRSGTDCSSTE